MTNASLSTTPSSAVSSPSSPMMAMPMVSVAAMKARVKAIQDVMKAVMKEGTHYGIIPGTPKPSLWKPGAEILCQVFGLVAETTTRVVCDDPEAEWSWSFARKNRSTQEEYTEEGTCIGYFEVEAVCTLYSGGMVVGRASARCNNRENKYRGLCIYDVRNTVDQMAAKRAHVAAVRTTTGCSDIFTQDTEDMAPEALAAGVKGGGAPTSARPVQSNLSPKQQEVCRTKGQGFGVTAEVVNYAIANVSKGEVRAFMDGVFAGNKSVFDSYAAALRARKGGDEATDQSAGEGAPVKPEGGQA